MDSNHRRRCQQIYSLPPLATRELLHIDLRSGIVTQRCSVVKYFFEYENSPAKHIAGAVFMFENDMRAIEKERKMGSYIYSPRRDIIGSLPFGQAKVRFSRAGSGSCSFIVKPALAADDKTIQGKCVKVVS